MNPSAFKEMLPKTMRLKNYKSKHNYEDKMNNEYIIEEL